MRFSKERLHRAIVGIGFVAKGIVAMTKKHSLDIGGISPKGIAAAVAGTLGDGEAALTLAFPQEFDLPPNPSAKQAEEKLAEAANAWALRVVDAVKSNPPSTFKKRHDLEHVTPEQQLANLREVANVLFNSCGKDKKGEAQRVYYGALLSLLRA